MISKTKGIVLHQLKYSESSIILKVYTEEFGLQSYILRGARRKKGKNNSSFLQPLTLVEIIANDSGKSTLNYITNISLHLPYKTIPVDLIKQSIVLFLNEVLYKSLQEHDPNKSLYDYISNSILILDQTDKPHNFHLFFLIHLSKFLGFVPENNCDNTHVFFDLQEGKFVKNRPLHGNYLNDRSSKVFSDILGMKFDGFQRLKITNEIRRELIRTLINYYQIHLDGIKNINSHLVLETVLE